MSETIQSVLEELLEFGYYDWSLQEEGGNEIGFLGGVSLSSATLDAQELADRLKRPVFLVPLMLRIEVAPASGHVDEENDDA